MLRGVLSGLTMGGVEQLVLRYLTEANIKCTPGAAFNSCASIAPAMAARLRHCAARSTLEVGTCSALRVSSLGDS